jgi:putative membrane protein
VTTGVAEPRGRLHPLAILVFARRIFRESLLPLVVLLFAAGPRVIVPVVVVGLPLAFGYLALAWLRFEYAIEGDRLVVRRGVVSRRTRIVPLDRIRGVDVRQPLLHRLLGLVQVDVEAASGGSRRAELGLAAVTPAQAEELRARVVALAPSADGSERPPARVLYRATPGLLALGGMTSWRYVLAPLAVIGILANVVDDLPGGLGDRLLGDLVHRAPTSVGGVVLAALAVLAAGLALGAAGSLLVDWQFTLLDEGERLSATRGLLTPRTVSIERARVRGADVRDTPLSRWAGIASVGAVAGGIQGREGGRATLAPAVPAADVDQLVRALEPAAPSTAARLEPHPPAARPRRLVRATAVPLAGVVVAAALGWWWVAASTLCLLALAVPVALDRYRQLGHRYDGRLLVVRGGTLLRRWTVLDPNAVVGYELRQSPGQKRAGLCTLWLHLGQGAGSRRVLDAGEEQARALLAALDAPLLAPLVSAAT